MLIVISFVISTLSLVEFSQALKNCKKTNMAKTQLYLIDENNLDIHDYPDAVEVGDPLNIKTALTLISIAEVCLKLNI
jgi:hypothetical protein